MALTEQKVLVEVSHIVIDDFITVKWVHQILRDGVIISAIPHRSTYTKEMKQVLKDEVGPAAVKYLALTKW